MEETEHRQTEMGNGEEFCADIDWSRPLYTKEYLLQQIRDWEEDGEESIPPPDFFCPLSLEVMVDPVVIASGHTYEKAYIDKWFQFGHKTCPKTNQVLAHIETRPNEAARKIIHQWCDSNGYDLPASISVSPDVDVVERAATANQDAARGTVHHPLLGRASRVQFRGQRIEFYRQQMGKRKLMGVAAPSREGRLLETLTTSASAPASPSAASPRLPFLKSGSLGAPRAVQPMAGGRAGDSPTESGASSSPGMVGRYPMPCPPSKGSPASSSADNKLSAVRNEEILQMLALASEDNFGQAHGMGGLRKISKISSASRLQLAENGAVPVLLRVIASGEGAALEHGLTTLLNLTLEETLKRPIVATGAIEVLIRHVMEPYNAECQATAIGALCNLAVLDANRLDIIQSGIVQKLIQIIGATNVSRMRHDTVLLLFNLAINEACREAIASAGCVQLLLYKLDEVELDEEVAADLLLLLSSLAKLPKVRETIQKLDGIRILSASLDSGSPLAQAHAVAVLLLVASDSTGRQAVEAEVMDMSLMAISEAGNKRGRAKAQALLKLLRAH